MCRRNHPSQPDILRVLEIENNRITQGLTPEEADDIFGFHETELY